MTQKGKITSWNDDKGFGFITPIPGGKQVFVHIKAFKKQSRRPEINRLVTYTLSTDKQGRPCAATAAMAAAQCYEKDKTNFNGLSFLLAGCFLFIVAICTLLGKIPLIVFSLYVVSSLASYLLYIKDKAAAKNDTWRTPENTLHLFSLMGGWPAALVAQQKLRHKTKKMSFRLVFWFTVMTNCIFFFLLLTPRGAATFKSLISNLI
ncbi:cold shock and DUF1294 domain-containing protein [Deltaproteobacteria bacterium IMCC39524]|nr:cold shock and DUF1294 domain-containing protein [Deltaproteobacteria bacterium IMCC39524]